MNRESAPPSLEARIGEIRDLPTLPHVVVRTMELLNAPDTTLREVGELVATDQVLSARTLRLVNAPYFGLRRRLQSVVEASVYLGRSGMRNLIVSSSILQTFSRSGEGPPPVRFWEHAFASAIFARLVAGKACRGKLEDAYLAGLLHDLGRLVLRHHFEPEQTVVERLAEATHRPLEEVEREAWGATHADVGYWLGMTWHLPRAVLEAVRHHHHPEAAAAEARLLSAAVHLGDEMAFEQSFGDEDAFDARHHGLEQGTQLLFQEDALVASPDTLREMVVEEARGVRMLVEMVYES
ncbi:MAG TPA: HDOD domain-containing protein [Candidatus Saccharimonadales bacterium]|nr:HDOD domain-containing protein [Candidatus Saccharimonadales bacterium]